MKTIQHFCRILKSGCKACACIPYQLQKSTEDSLISLKEERKLIYFMEGLKLSEIENLRNVKFLADPSPWRYTMDSLAKTVYVKHNSNLIEPKIFYINMEDNKIVFKFIQRTFLHQGVPILQ